MSCCRKGSGCLGALCFVKVRSLAAEKVSNTEVVEEGKGGEWWGMVSPLDLGSLHTRDLQTAVFLTCKAEIPHSLHHCSTQHQLFLIARFFLNTRVTSCRSHPGLWLKLKSDAAASGESWREEKAEYKSWWEEDVKGCWRRWALLLLIYNEWLCWREKEKGQTEGWQEWRYSKTYTHTAVRRWTTDRMWESHFVALYSNRRVFEHETSVSVITCLSFLLFLLSVSSTPSYQFHRKNDWNVSTSQLSSN